MHFIVPLPDGRTLDLGVRTLVMGILNLTPDSFADGGSFASPSAAIDAAQRMEQAGVDLVDVGGESTRPGAEPLALDEELARVMPVIEGLTRRLSLPVSIDTYKAGVAERALQAGASIVNDVSALRYDSALAEVVARSGAAVVLMHNRGRSSDMYRQARYSDVVSEVAAELRERADAALAAGIGRARIVLDPGIGFAKQAAHSLTLLARLPELTGLGFPLLVGPSRKSFLKAALGEREPGAREWGTAAAVTAAVLGGAHIVRVHGVEAMVDVVRTADAIRNATPRTSRTS